MLFRQLSTDCKSSWKPSLFKSGVNQQHFFIRLTPQHATTHFHHTISNDSCRNKLLQLSQLLEETLATASDETLDTQHPSRVLAMLLAVCP